MLGDGKLVEIVTENTMAESILRRLIWPGEKEVERGGRRWPGE